MKQLLVFFLVASVCGEGWDSNNDPSLFANNAQTVLQNLNLTAQLQKSPWSDTYWPSFLSGIAHRWYSSNPNDFNYQMSTKSQLKKMAISNLKLLSPAEKYDIFVGRYDYPTVKSEWMRTSPQDEKWEGLCHGWAPASLFYDQPNPILLTNADGITIPFGSSDVKALLTYFTAEYDEQRSPSSFMGDRCTYDIVQNPKYANTPACRDINAGTYHITIANQIGNNNVGFIVDRDRSIQVWNQPVFYYSSTIGKTRPPSNGSAPGTVKEVQISTTMTYGKETQPAWDAHPTYPVSENYQYWLELGSQGNIIGGSHVTWDRPDFQWIQQQGQFYGYFSALQSVYAASTNTTVESKKAVTTLKTKAKHTHMNNKVGEFGLSNYTANHIQSWTIAPDNSEAILIQFDTFETERYRHKVKIFEGASGEGALIAVLHGNIGATEIKVNSPAVYVVFRSDSPNSGAFHATYTGM